MGADWLPPHLVYVDVLMAAPKSDYEISEHQKWESYATLAVSAFSEVRSPSAAWSGVNISVRV